MFQRFKRGLVALTVAAAMLCNVGSAEAGWGHHGWGHHGFGWGGYYGGWGSYTSIRIGYPRYRIFAPSYGVRYYSSFYAPRVFSYSVGWPTYYVAPTYVPTYYAPPTYYVPTYSTPLCTTNYYSTSYVAPSYYTPSVSSYCYDPCSTVAPSVSYPTYPSSTPLSDPLPTYSTGVDPAGNLPAPVVARNQVVPSVTSGGSFVDRMLGRTSVSSLANRTTAPSNQTAGVARVAARPVLASAQVRQASDSMASVRNNVIADQVMPIPAALLDTADQMFAHGGYAEAASAYAQLTVRYGNHDQLAVRRFIALVASGDCDQAAVVHELAAANRQALTASQLPGSNLAQLYGLHLGDRKLHADKLASYALQRPQDATALAMVGTWLELDQQPERAQLFHQRARMLTDEEDRFAASPSGSTRLVGTAPAR